MIAEMYQRRMKGTVVAAVAVLAIIAVWLLFNWPHSGKDWLEASVLLLPLGFIIAVGFTSRHKYHQVKDIHVPEAVVTITELDHLVIKKDVGFFPQLLLFQKNGTFIGKVKPVRAPFWLYPLDLILKELTLLIFPVTYGFYTTENQKLFTFRRKGLLNTTVMIYAEDGKTLGVYEQTDLKSLLTIKGTLYDPSGEKLLPVNVKGFSGDFRLKDEDGKQWAHFFNGYFPHEYTNLFRDIDNDIVDLAKNLAEKEKQLLIALVSFLFVQKRQR
ncbi:hypothetical protein [Lentibacillus juripiscarius]|uniref:DUF3137 domain-containing protein n=1 Tax=Lentibacillus juripiscarius TaxID=257446 RepID=A0ABW5V9R6_9BACI